MKELNIIQTELVSNKDLNNEFSNFMYRSLETILTSVKPLLKKTVCTLTFTDDLVLIGERYYIKSTAVLRNSAGESVSAVAFAREQASKKGMDEAQVTGAASSYARKYAACSLLGISDGWDPDALDNREEGQNPVKKAGAKAAPANGLSDAIKAAKAAKNRAELDAVWGRYAVYQSEPTFVQACNDRAMAL